LTERSDRLPMVGDRIMCVKNNHMLGLLNGQIWEVKSDAVVNGGGTVSLHIKDPDSEVEMAISACEKLFYGQPLTRWEHEEDIQEFEYAYAITVHKAQGSQWDNVLLFDQKHRFPNWSERDRRRWLYTGITRAAETVTVLRL
jgi:Mesyanzhinovviridae Dda-like helicase